MFAATKYPVVPFPVPALPELIEIQSLFEMVVQAQPVCVLMPMVPVPPAAVKLLEPGVIEKVQLLPPAWVTVKVSPAIFIVPVLDVDPVLAATVKPTVPLPLPVAPEVILIH